MKTKFRVTTRVGGLTRYGRVTAPTAQDAGDIAADFMRRHYNGKVVVVQSVEPVSE